MSTSLRPLKMFILLFLTGGFSTMSFAQDEDFRKKFVDANYHIEYENYDLAVPIFKELAAQEPDNANLNYKVGYSIIMSNKNKRTAVPYLEKAVANTTVNYDDLNPFEKKAPISAYYYLGVAYHVANDLDKATETFNKFKEVAGKKHYLIPEADHSIAQVAFAREQMKNPVNVNITSLSDSINTEFPEYSPVISIDETTIIFTSRRPSTTGGQKDIDGQYFEDIYVSTRKSDGTWSSPQPIGANINTVEHEATIGLSADGQSLLIYKGEEGGSIHMSELVGDEWSVPTRLGSDINSEDWETHAAMSSDSRVLYFTSNRPGGFGGRDIWLVKRLPNGMWAQAQNAGPVINTRYDEEAPFLHPDGQQLFFSSQGHQSMGGFDIFFSEMDEEGKWNKPTNIGYPINTTDDDVFYVTSADGRRGYYSSIREDGAGDKDIYLITLPDVIEKPLTVLIGYIRTNSGERIPANIEVTVDNVETGETTVYRPNTSTGKYVLALNPGTYKISYQLDGTDFYTEDIFVPAESAYQQINKELELDLVTLRVKDLSPVTGDETTDNTTTDNTSTDGTTTEVISTDVVKVDAGSGKDKVVVQPYPKLPSTTYQEFFDYNVNRINVNDPKFKTLIDTVAAHLSRYGEARIAVESSASKVPTRTYGSNQKLTRLRADEAKKIVQEEIRKRNLDPSKIKFVSTSSLVLGPQYQGDAVSGRDKYRPYQFVKLITK